MLFAEMNPLKREFLEIIPNHCTRYILFLDDTLWLVKIFALDILKTKLAKIILRRCLIFHVTLEIIQIYFHLFILHVDDHIKFSPVFFGMLYVSF
jgi:hypothetical protein